MSLNLGIRTDTGYVLLFEDRPGKGSRSPVIYIDRDTLNALMECLRRHAFFDRAAYEDILFHRRRGYFCVNTFLETGTLSYYYYGDEAKEVSRDIIRILTQANPEVAARIAALAEASQHTGDVNRNDTRPDGPRGADGAAGAPREPDGD